MKSIIYNSETKKFSTVEIKKFGAEAIDRARKADKYTVHQITYGDGGKDYRVYPDAPNVGYNPKDRIVFRGGLDVCNDWIKSK